jgi:MFS family permease
LVAATSLMGMSQSVLMPIFADRILKAHSDSGGERLLGILLGAAGFGALCGSLYLASRRTVLGLGRVIACACASLGMSIMLFAVSRSLLFSLPLLAIAGGSLVVAMASCNTVLQTIVEDDKRGRVMSLFTMCFLGVAPFGSLLAGAVANVIGAPWTLALAGAGSLAAGIVFALKLPSLRPHIRPIYQKKGILPQVAEGLQSAAIVTAATHE